ncbi:MAG: flippase-like domain-containing protein [Anaerolineales bacterium]|nr:flippase-like domain-containing protein [Anaerolineales bacterium]
MRKFFFILFIFLGAAFVFLSFGEIESIVQTLQRGNIWFIILALLIQCGWFILAGSMIHALYRIVGLDESLKKMALLYAAGTFVGTVMPSAGMGAVAVFLSEARRNGQSTGKVTVASMLYIVTDYIAFLCVLALGLIVLFRRHNLDATEILASAIMFSIAALLSFLLYLGSKSDVRLGNALARIAHFLNRVAHPFIRRDYLSEEKMRAYAHEMAEDLRALPQRSRSLIKPFLFAFANKTLLMGVLTIIFIAFRIPFTAGTIIGGFSITYLFTIISPTPSGIGIVEGAMPLALSSLNVPWSQAVIVTLAYRGVTFWFPLAVGAWALRVLHIDARQAELTTDHAA